MGTRLRKIMLALLFVSVIPFAVATPATGAALADCPSGTHWDTITQTCH